MKDKFGLWPKIALLLILGAFTLQKVQFAEGDLKATQTEHVYSQNQPGVQAVEAQVAKTQSQSQSQSLADYQLHEVPLDRTDCKSAPVMELPVMYAQVEGSTNDTLDVGDPIDPAPNTGGGLWALIKQNWALVVTALLGLIEVIVRLTPTEKDNSLFNFLKYILDRIIPNQRKEGGAHN